jgi:hypothetical protein
MHVLLCHKINESHGCLYNIRIFPHIPPNAHFCANKILFYSCPHTPYFAPIAFRKKYYKSPKMSVTLLCLVKGNTLANAFSVKISREEPISELKDAIKAKNLANVDLKTIVTISGAISHSRIMKNCWQQEK